jgi:hypothetical protein
MNFLNFHLCSFAMMLISHISIEPSDSGISEKCSCNLYKWQCLKISLPCFHKLMEELQEKEICHSTVNELITTLYHYYVRHCLLSGDIVNIQFQILGPFPTFKYKRIQWCWLFNGPKLVRILSPLHPMLEMTPISEALCTLNVPKDNVKCPT